MGARNVWVSILAIGLATGSVVTASAADLYGEAYEDPRYADIYGSQDRAHRDLDSADRHDDDDDDNDDRRGPHHGYTDDRDAHDRYAHDRHSHDRYALGRHDHSERGADGCVAGEAIRDDLERDGWGNFKDRVDEGATVVIEAERRNGGRFELRIDRCSGEIVDARPVGRGAHDNLARGDDDDDFVDERDYDDRRWADARPEWHDRRDY